VSGPLAVVNGIPMSVKPVTLIGSQQSIAAYNNNNSNNNNSSANTGDREQKS